MNTSELSYWINQLDLSEHPEGGYYKETYRSEKRFNGRNLTTNIFYLLPAGIPSRFHRLKYDEFWYFHYGSPLNLYFFNPDGGFERHVLGSDLEKGHELSLLVPGGTIFGGEVTEPESFILVSCNMSPGFEFDDFELLSYDEMYSMFPDYDELIKRLSC
jgi:predicted cupin superfamily sugar epimerase